MKTNKRKIGKHFYEEVNVKNKRNRKKKKIKHQTMKTIWDKESN